MPSIGVLEHTQKPTDKPRRIKKSGGQSLVNQGKADWVIRNVLLKMRPELEYVAPPDNANLIMEYSGISPTRRWEWRGKIDRLPVRDWKENLLLSYPIADQRSHPAY